MKLTAAQRLLPYFAAASFLAGAGCAPRLQDAAAPLRPMSADTAAPPPAQNDDAPETANTPETASPEKDAAPAFDWRDYLRLNGRITPRVTEAMDKIFSIPEAQAALTARAEKYRQIQDYLDKNMGKLMPVTDDLTRVREAATNKPVINIVTSDALAQITEFDSKPTFINDELLDVWINPKVTVGLKQSEQYLTTYGGFHDFTFEATLTHEIAHLVLELRDEDEATKKTNEWLGIIAPELPERGDYYFRRLQPQTPECMNFKPPQVAIKAVNLRIAFDDERKKTPDMRMPVLHDAKGAQLQGNAFYTRLAQVYYSACPGYKGPQPKLP